MEQRGRVEQRTTGSNEQRERTTGAGVFDFAIQQDYPLTEPVYLYLRPKAPAVAKEFCKFVTGADAAEIIKRSEFWPEYYVQHARAKRR